jgi:hypothetical protein
MPHKPNPLAIDRGDRMACYIPEFERISGLGKTSIYTLIREGKLKTVRLGRRQQIILSSYYALLDQALAEPKSPGYGVAYHRKDRSPPTQKSKIARASDAGSTVNSEEEQPA